MKSLSLSKPHLIVMVGITGAGKSFFAEQFAETFQAPLASRERIEKALDIDRIASKKIDALLDQQVTELFKTKQSFILDGRGHTKIDRQVLINKARTHNYETLLIWVQTEPTTAKQRSTKVAKDQPKRKPLTPEQHDAAVRRFAAPHATEKPIVISGKHTYATQAKIVLRKLAEPRADISVHSTTPARSRPAGTHSITVR